MLSALNLRCSWSFAVVWGTIELLEREGRDFGGSADPVKLVKSSKFKARAAERSIDPESESGIGVVGGAGIEAGVRFEGGFEFTKSTRWSKLSARGLIALG